MRQKKYLLPESEIPTHYFNIQAIMPNKPLPFLHLEHGFWSMFQTIGWNNKKWLKRLKVIGIIIAALIVLLFVATAVNAHIEAGRLL